jgi:hypothetical protein
MFKERHLDLNECSSPPVGRDLNGPANGAYSFSHAYQAQTAFFVTHVKPYPIINDQQQDSPIFGRELYLHLSSLAMSDDVMQCFLGDTIETHRN